MDNQSVPFLRADGALSPQASGIAVGEHAMTETRPYWLPLVMLLSVLFWAGVTWAVV